MVIAVCTDSQDEFEIVKRAVENYATDNNLQLAPRKFSAMEYQKEQSERRFPITFFALDDVMNQELAIIARERSKESQLVWIGTDKRFGVASYRVAAANFLLKPVTEQGIYESLDRCMQRLVQSGIALPICS